MEIISDSLKKTDQIAKDLAKKVLKLNQNQSVVLALSGNLGGGKTTFLKSFAKGLGVKERVLSPSFVVFRRFSLKHNIFKNFYHFDCYRLDDVKDLAQLGLEEIIKDKQNIVAIEWAGKVKKVLPENNISLEFEFIDENKRKISITGI